MDPQDFDLTPQEQEELKQHLQQVAPQHAQAQTPGGAGAAIDPAVVGVVIDTLVPFILSWLKNRKARKGGGGTAPATH